MSDWRRAGRRLRRWLRALRRAPPVWLVYDAGYTREVSGVPIDPLRGERIVAFLTDEGLLRRADIRRPLPASLSNIRRVHTDGYLDALQDPQTLTGILGLPVTEASLEETLALQRLIVGGTIQATRLALQTGRIAVHLAGGLHHAEPERGMGFCVFNDIAVAIARLRARGWREPILVVDLDLHDGNGTRRAFADDPTVHTFSIHNTDWWDGPAVAATTVALGTGVDDATFLAALHRELPPVIARHRPGLVIYLAGTDPAADDVLGDWRLSADGLFARDQFVVEQIRAAAGEAALAIVLGGGYGPRTWRYTARFVAWLITGRRIEPPDRAEEVLRRYRRAVHELAEVAQTPDPGDGWDLSEEDLFGVAGRPTRRTRVLDYYSVHGLELLLERVGLLTQIRALGYPRPVLSVDFSADLGETIRIFGAEDRAELLMELRLCRTRRQLPGEEVIAVEWLLLQNPRASFPPGTDPLPGQSHPGLHLLREVVGWVIVMAERLGLAGVTFVPSHYYMAFLGRRLLRFIDPEVQGRFEAQARALAGLDPTEASHALAQGRVRLLASGEPLPWQPGPMLIPVSPALKVRQQGPQYAAAAAAAAARYACRLEPVAAP